APAAATIHTYPPLRAFIQDVMEEGQRKHIVNLQLEVDVTQITQIRQHAKTTQTPSPSLTSYLAHALAQAVQANKAMHAYRQGRKVVVFDEIDIAVMVERDIAGHQLPVPTIVRNAAHKDALQIHGELAHAKTWPLGTDGPFCARDVFFFSLPRWVRKLVWQLIRRDPQLFKQVVGTVGLTSMGMHGSGKAVFIPITPMTLTLSVGTIGKRLSVIDGQTTERDVLQLN